MKVLQSVLNYKLMKEKASEKEKEKEPTKHLYAICPRCARIWDAYTCTEKEGRAILPCGHVINAGLYELVVAL